MMNYVRVSKWPRESLWVCLAWHTTIINQLKVQNMETEKRLQTKDGLYRLSIYREEYADSPRDMWDYPLHCEDWHRDYTIMNKSERDGSERSCSNLLRYLFRNYGIDKKIVAILKENGKSTSHCNYDNALIYDRSRKEWVLYSWQPNWRDYQGIIHEAHWEEETSFCCKAEYITAYDLHDILSDETIETLVCSCLSDEIKVMGYDFHYYGEISFSKDFSSKSDGIAWLEKSEAVGEGKWLTEEQWKTQDCYDLSKGEIEEIEAWAEGRVYYFVVEKAVMFKHHKECVSEDRKPEDYEELEWEQVDSCGGFYGDIKYAIEYACDDNDFTEDELEEVA